MFLRITSAILTILKLLMILIIELVDGSLMSREGLADIVTTLIVFVLFNIVLCFV